MRFAWRIWKQVKVGENVFLSTWKYFLCSTMPLSPATTSPSLEIIVHLTAGWWRTYGVIKSTTDIEYISNWIFQPFAFANVFDIIFGLSETEMCEITLRPQRKEREAFGRGQAHKACLISQRKWGIRLSSRFSHPILIGHLSSQSLEERGITQCFL